MTTGRRWPRRERADLPFLPEWRGVLAVRVRHWAALTAQERERVEHLAHRLMLEKRWEAARGFELTDEIVVTIAGQAALMAMGLPDDVYRKVGNVLVHPRTIVSRGEHAVITGVMTDAPTPLLGESHFDGQVLIAWNAALRDTRHPGNGHNVVFHEFAHQLDMLDGTIDGTPPMPSQDLHDRWVEVCTDVYEEVAAGEGGEVLDPYAGVNPGEFFAVATEVFFDDPLGLEEEHPDLYEVLSEFYGVDPVEWEERAAGR